MSGARFTGDLCLTSDGRWLVRCEMSVATRAEAEDFARWLREAVTSHVANRGGLVLPFATDKVGGK